MKKLIAILFLNILFASNANAGYGSGELILSDNVVYNFQRYLQGKRGAPMRFLVTEDGKNSFWWYCPYERCASNGSKEKKICEKESNQSCSRFSNGRYIRWDNGINPKGKAAKFSSKMTENEIKNKLTKLGFYKNNLTINTKVNDTKDKVTSSDKSLLEQLEALTQMFKDGLISEEEFKKAKKKILN